MASDTWDPDSLAKLSRLRGTTGFPTTRWSLVLDAAEQQEPALQALFAAYWPPMYAFARRSGDDPEVAADLIQDLFASVLDRQDLTQVDPARGRFRSWLLGALKHLRANRRVRERAAKRGGGAVAVPLEDAERTYAIASPDASPEELYDRLWAQQILQTARDRTLDGARPLVRDLGPLLEDLDVPSYAVLAARHATSEGAVKVAAHRLRRRYEAMIEAVIRETVADGELLFAEKNALGL